MIRVLFFASLREHVGRDDLELEAAAGDTVAEVRSRVADELPGFAETLERGRVLSAVNETMADDNTAVCDRDAVAFFPPVTGG